jgi:uncharacterized membrane protein YdbT with pleckstrin-like domain
MPGRPRQTVTFGTRRIPALTQTHAMHFHATLGPVVSLIAGVLILLVPRLLNYIVAVYLILMGLLGILALGGFPLR